MNDREVLKVLISENSEFIDFGSFEDAVEDIWIIKAEAVLGHKLPKSYVWFLKNYSGGEVFHEEIYSIYGIDFDTISGGGDIVYQHLTKLKNNITSSEHVTISETDLGETFFFDFSKYEENECPIYLRLPSGTAIKYSSDFYGYLKKRIEAYMD